MIKSLGRIALTVVPGLLAAGCQSKEPAAPAARAPSTAAAQPGAASHAASAPPTQAAAPPAHGGHESQHGGAVFMVGEVHYEVVLDKGGQHRVYVTDGMRKPIAASTFESVRLTVKRPGAEPEALTLARSPDDAYWSAQGRPVDDPATTATVTYGYLGTTQKMDVAMTGGGGGHGGEPAGPHGGVVQPSGDGRLELLADRGGSFKLWLLDAQGASRPLPDGANARVKVALPGYAEVPLKAAGDHFAGQGAPLNAEHAAAIAVVDAGGKTETTRFGLHLEADDGHGEAGEGHGEAHEHEHGSEHHH
jgi:hypothetical protein